MTPRSICVYCSSASPTAPWLASAVREFGAGLAGRGWRLVYGGASVGAMGELADAVLDAGGQVLGVIPKALVGREVAHAGLSELRVVDTMHERKAAMFANGDALVAFPGGFGTMEEIFEMITWKQLGIHNKPIVLVNLSGYFDPLLAQFERGIAEGLIRPEHRILYAVADSVARAFTYVTEAQVMPRPTGKWY
jgi:uncharacterized protein (TIGR00730 family)